MFHRVGIFRFFRILFPVLFSEKLAQWQLKSHSRLGPRKSNLRLHNSHVGKLLSFHWLVEPLAEFVERFTLNLCKPFNQLS